LNKKDEELGKLRARLAEYEEKILDSDLKIKVQDLKLRNEAIRAAMLKVDEVLVGSAVAEKWHELMKYLKSRDNKIKDLEKAKHELGVKLEKQSKITSLMEEDTQLITAKFNE
jgi:hypothetical protein